MGTAGCDANQTAPAPAIERPAAANQGQPRRLVPGHYKLFVVGFDIFDFHTAAATAVIVVFVAVYSEESPNRWHTYRILSICVEAVGSTRRLPLNTRTAEGNTQAEKQLYRRSRRLPRGEFTER